MVKNGLHIEFRVMEVLYGHKAVLAEDADIEMVLHSALREMRRVRKEGGRDPHPRGKIIGGLAIWIGGELWNGDTYEREGETHYYYTVDDLSMTSTFISAFERILKRKRESKKPNRAAFYYYDEQSGSMLEEGEEIVVWSYEKYGYDYQKVAAEVVTLDPDDLMPMIPTRFSTQEMALGLIAATRQAKAFAERLAKEWILGCILSVTSGCI